MEKAREKKSLETLESSPSVKIDRNLESLGIAPVKVVMEKMEEQELRVVTDKGTEEGLPETRLVVGKERKELSLVASNSQPNIIIPEFCTRWRWTLNLSPPMSWSSIARPPRQKRL